MGKAVSPLLIHWRHRSLAQAINLTIAFQVASMEERLNSKADHDRERETEAQRNKKLMKLSEKYKQELHHARLELAEMKTRLMEGQDAKVIS